MLRRLLPGLLVAALLMGAAYVRDHDPVLDPALMSHGAGACDPDGVTVGYAVTFRDDLSPKGYRVSEVRVHGISSDCIDHEIAVALTSGSDIVARSWGTTISSESMSLPLRSETLARLIDGVQVKIDDATLPPAPDPSVSPTPTEAGPTPSVSPSAGESVPPATMNPAPPPSIPAMRRDPAGSPLPRSDCDPTLALCGTTGRDAASIHNGNVATGPGADTIAVTTDADTDHVEVHAGSGADVITLDFDDVEPGSAVHVEIDSGDGPDMIELAGSVPPGVSVRISAGAGNDVITAGGSTDVHPSDASSPESTWGGYGIDGMSGDDTLRGGLGPDVITGGSGADVIAGRAGADELFGGSHGDVLRGGAGNDHIDGGGSGDTLVGGSGDDELAGDRGKDACRSGSGAVIASSCEGFAR
jgi:hypothetical protein